MADQYGNTVDGEQWIPAELLPLAQALDAADQRGYDKGHHDGYYQAKGQDTTHCCTGELNPEQNRMDWYGSEP